jgi:hypothetical protein
MQSTVCGGVLYVYIYLSLMIHCIIYIFLSTHIISRLEAKELKMLRVAVSSFYDYLTVILKTMQEFDTTMMMDNTSSS